MQISNDAHAELAAAQISANGLEVTLIRRVDRKLYQANALDTLIQIIRIVVPLAAAAQRERRNLGIRTMDYLGDMRYTLTSIEGAQARVDPWIGDVSRLFFEDP